MKSFILNESAFSSSTALVKKNPNTIEFICTLQEADKPNRNGRIYPKRVLEAALNMPYVQERLRTKSWFGETGHPLDTSVQRQMTIDFRNSAFMIKEIWWEGNLLKGKLETLDTSLGHDMKGIIEQGSQVAFSLRAQGNVHQDPVSGKTIVDSPLNICTYDYVINPSHDKAFLDHVCESTFVSMFGTNNRNDLVALCEAENFYNNGLMIDLSEVEEIKEIDYVKTYNTGVKVFKEMYVPNENDEVVALGETVSIKNGSIIKKVCLEDYLVKDFRATFMKLFESSKAQLKKADETLKNPESTAEEIKKANLIIDKHNLGKSAARAFSKSEKLEKSGNLKSAEKWEDVGYKRLEKGQDIRAELKHMKESSDFELMQWLDENGYEPTKENVEILKEGITDLGIGLKGDALKQHQKHHLEKQYRSGHKVYIDPDSTERSKKANQERVLKQAKELGIELDPEIVKKHKLNESSDFELMQWLDKNGYETSRENVEILREELLIKLSGGDK